MTNNTKTNKHPKIVRSAKGEISKQRSKPRKHKINKESVKLFSIKTYYAAFDKLRWVFVMNSLIVYGIVISTGAEHLKLSDSVLIALVASANVIPVMLNFIKKNP